MKPSSSLVKLTFRVGMASDLFSLSSCCGAILELRLAKIASGVPPSPLSIGIMGLGRKSRQIFGFKGLIGKVFRNKHLAPQIALKMALGQLRGPSWFAARLFTAPFSPYCRAW